MTRKTKLRITDDTEYRYQNWVAQILSLMMPWSLYWVAGRASAKTVQVLAERVQEAAQDCPGAPFVWVADTYSDLHKNEIPSLIDGLKLAGWHLGRHYVIGEQPPEEWRVRMYNVGTEWRNTMVFYTGFNFTFVSLDRMAIGAGRSYVGLFGDEVKYFPEDKFTNLLKAVRGFYVKYGQSVWYRSRTLTTDMPNPGRLGEYDWILKMGRQNDKEKLTRCLKAGIVYNETKITYVSCLQKYEKLQAEYRTGTAVKPELDKAARAVESAKHVMKRWEKLWVKARSRVSFFLISSSYVNADILGIDWFRDEISEGLEGLNTNVLSIIPKIEASLLFYPNLTMRNFFADGFLNDIIDKQPLGWEEDCSVLRHLDSNRFLEAGMDSGNMLSLVLGQRQGHTYYLLKELYTLPPETPRSLADKFLRYFAPMKHKTLRLYYDRSMNNYARVRADMASQIKNCIERDGDDRATGWRVQLMSLGQGNIGSNLEYRFMQDLMAGNLENKLFRLQIDQYNCACLKAEMECTKTKAVQTKNGSTVVVKEKSGDKLPTARLPKESTNLTDAFKYLVMRKEWLRIWQSKVVALPM